MTVVFEGYEVEIPNGYKKTDEGTFVTGHGTEYQLVLTGWNEPFPGLECVSNYGKYKSVNYRKI